MFIWRNYLVDILWVIPICNKGIIQATYFVIQGFSFITQVMSSVEHAFKNSKLFNSRSFSRECWVLQSVRSLSIYSSRNSICLSTEVQVNKWQYPFFLHFICPFYSGILAIPTVQNLWIFSGPYCHKQYTSSTSLFQKAGMNSLLLGLRINSSSYDSIKIPVPSREIDFPIAVPSICVHMFPSKSLKWVSSVHISIN